MVRRAPHSSSNRAVIFSRSLKPYRKALTAPRSIPKAPHHNRWDWMRCSSETITRMYSPRSGTPMPRAFSMAMHTHRLLMWLLR